ncbi:hypothetical protein ACFH04_11825 [Streptomyces noboritoensis]|uniref:Uncharacterized protein n=1 Tax=Streptomyces noboritoensis TaxID=67337 RepID=A0ABV6TF13_9ACTN
MRAPSFALRLLPEEELIGDPRPEACVEVSFGPLRPERDMVLFPQPVRMTPADLVRLRMEAELVLGEIRAEVLRAEIAWERALGEWYEEGRAAIEARKPDEALLVRVLEGLRRDQFIPA